MSRKEIFQKAFAYLLGNSKIKSKTELAEKMGSTRSTVSKAYSGDTNYLTDDFIRKFTAAFPGVFSLQGLLSGNGPLLAENSQEDNKSNGMTNSSDENISKLLEQNKELIDVLKKSLEESQRTNSILLNELSELRKELTSQKTELVESI